MARNNQELSSQVAQNGGKVTPLAVQHTLEKWKSHHLERLVALAGSKENADKVFVTCMNTIARSPGLLECEPSTVTACILQSFQLNLFPGPFGECAYIPLNNNKTGKKEANFWPMYQGIVKLLRNAGNKAIVARVVHEGDYFEYFEGWKAPVYAPAVVVGNKRGKRLFVYAAICTMSDMWQVEVMSPEQIETIKSRSPGARKSDSPWNSRYEDDVDAMWAKTCLKRVAKMCTKSAELIKAVELDDVIEGGDEAVPVRPIFDPENPTPLSEPDTRELDAPYNGESIQDSQKSESVYERTNLGAETSAS